MAEKIALAAILFFWPISVDAQEALLALRSGTVQIQNLEEDRSEIIAYYLHHQELNLMSDGRIWHLIDGPEVLFIHPSGELSRMNLLGSGVPIIPNAMAVNESNNTWYWADNYHIGSFSPGLGSKVLVEYDEWQDIDNLLFEPVTGQLMWSDSSGIFALETSNPQSSPRSILQDVRGVDQLAADARTETIVASTAAGTIRGSFDGSDRTVLNTSSYRISIGDGGNAAYAIPAGTGGTLSRIDLATGNEVELDSQEDERFYSLQVDELNNWIYWLATEADTIFRIRPNGSEKEIVAESAGEFLVDAQNNRIYLQKTTFPDPAFPGTGMTLQVLDLQSGDIWSAINLPQLPDLRGLHYWRDLSIDVDTGKIFWPTAQGLYTSFLDLGNIEKLTSNQHYSISLDRTKRRVYMLGFGQMTVLDYDGRELFRFPVDFNWALNAFKFDELGRRVFYALTPNFNSSESILYSLDENGNDLREESDLDQVLLDIEFDYSQNLAYLQFGSEIKPFSLSTSSFVGDDIPVDFASSYFVEALTGEIYIESSEGIIRVDSTGQRFFVSARPASKILLWGPFVKTSTEETRPISRSLDIYPNPTTKIISIRISDDFADSKATANIYDATGRRVKTVLHLASPQRFSVDVSDLSAGRYLLEISNGVLRETSSFVVISN